ncbi:hypothetical protein FPW49_18230 [Vibrio cholerae]|nr:hypothetical protein FPW20_06605 [Vibrio cholerae]TVN21997.1 hypothetical protein FPW04_17095 [Vibrio cholerae]TVN26225.1 hypothetical protein FPW27_15065 [Vibrio cholerae]TVN30106.1 hypothetical protein FPW49_18230 [Vibrio cholerae]TVN39016.1 hypothetical protein FPW57_09925 [Vibrio cholerae]
MLFIHYHPEFNKATQDINGNICFKYVS